MLHVDHGGASNDQDMRGFRPRRISFDDAHIKEKDILDARTIAAVRDYPMLARAFRRKRDEIIGPHYRMECKPVWRMLPPPFSQKFSRQWGRLVAMLFEADCESSDCWLDARGQKTHTQILQQGLNTYKKTGEIIPVYKFSEGIGPFATRVMPIDPGRVRTPQEFNGKNRREKVVGGFAINSDGYAYKAYIHDDLKDAGSSYVPGKKKTWKALMRKVDDGQRVQWAHIYDDEFPGCTRGRNGYSAAIKFTNMLSTYEKNVLRAAALQARQVAFLKTKFPERAMEGLKSPAQFVDEALDMVDSFYDDQELNIGESVIGHLMPFDEYEETKPTQPINTFEEFESANLRHLAAGADMGYSEFTGDYRQSSYSTARQEDTKSQTSNESLKGNIIDPYADFNATNWMEEQISNGRIPIKGLDTSRERLKFFRTYKPYLASFCWHGSADKHIDPVKSAVAENIRTTKGSQLKSSSIAKNENMALEDWIDDKAYETQQLTDAGLGHLVVSDENTQTGRTTISGEVDRLSHAYATQEY